MTDTNLYGLEATCILQDELASETVPPPPEWQKAKEMVDQHRNREAQLGDDLLPSAPLAVLAKALRNIHDRASRPPASEAVMRERMDQIALDAGAALVLVGIEP